MKSFNALFDGKSEIEYNGKVISKYFKLDIPGEYSIKFRYISKKSKYNQSIVILFNDFDGQFDIFGRKQVISNSRFPKFNFWIETAPKEIDINILLKGGTVMICNGSDPIGNMQICHTLHMGCAIYIEQLDEKTYRFYCNDHENDDDFDDLVFDMELKQYQSGDGSMIDKTKNLTAPVV